MADLLDALAFGLRAIEATCPACQRADCACRRYCAECDCLTNHSTEQHRAAEADGRKEP